MPAGKVLCSVRHAYTLPPFETRLCSQTSKALQFFNALRSNHSSSKSKPSQRTKYCRPRLSSSFVQDPVDVVFECAVGSQYRVGSRDGAMGEKIVVISRNTGAKSGQRCCVGLIDSLLASQESAAIAHTNLSVMLQIKEQYRG